MNIISFKSSLVLTLTFTSVLLGYDVKAIREKEEDVNSKRLANKNNSLLKKVKRGAEAKGVSLDDREQEEKNSTELMGMGDSYEDLGDFQPMDIESGTEDINEDDTQGIQLQPIIPVFEQLTGTQQHDLIERANKGDQTAQDEIVSRLYHGMLFFLNREDINFKAWHSHKTKIEFDERYVFFVLRACTSEEINVNFPNLFPQLKKRAELGQSMAQLNLGYAYWKGKGVPRDDGKAFKWIKKAAYQGLPHAQNILGVAHSRGIGMPQDEAEDFSQLVQAALSTNTLQMFCAQAKLENHTCREHLKESVIWYEKAARQGLPSAQYNLADRFRSGVGVPKNLKKAVKWYKKASIQGHAPSQFKLAGAYWKGAGGPKDIDAAVEWTYLSAKQNDRIAIHMFMNIFPFQQEAPFESKWSPDLFELSNDLSSITSRHEMKSIVNNTDGGFIDCDFAIPPLQRLYEKLVEVEDELNGHLINLSRVKPGFMVTCIKASEDLKGELLQQVKTRFIDIYRLGEDEYITLGKENVATARKHVEFLGGVKKKIKKADRQLKKILLSLQPLDGLMAAQSVALKSKEGKKWFVKEQKRAKRIKEANAPQIKVIEKQREKLTEVKDVLLNYIPKGVGVRNKDFIESEGFGFFKP